jgi:rRNA-processing protein EBP2
MGKKNVKFNPDEEEVREEVEENEYEAELQAVMAIRAEREAEQQNPESSSSSSSNKPNTYNREGLIAALENLETRELPFIQTMQINECSLELVNELDDIERETAFYSHALQAVKEGYNRLQVLGVPCIRPNDFFCEQVKSDAHMARIKDRLVIEEKRMDAFEKRKNREQNRKYNKQVSELKKQEYKKSEQQVFNEVAKLRKGKAPGGGGEDTEAKLEKILNSHGGDEDRPQQGKKRMAMDKKYGFGGRDKKRAKMNDKK